MTNLKNYHTFVSVQSLSCVQLFATPWTIAYQASLFFPFSQSLLKFMSSESVMLSNHLIHCCPFLLLPSIFPSIGVFSNKSALHIRWQKYWCFAFSISPLKEYSGLIFFFFFPFIFISWRLITLQHCSGFCHTLTLGLTDLILQSKGLSRVFSSTAIRKHQFFEARQTFEHLPKIG